MENPPKQLSLLYPVSKYIMKIRRKQQTLCINKRPQNGAIFMNEVFSMIEGITNRPTSTANAKTTAAQSIQGSFQSALSSAVAQTSQTQDTLEISGMSDWQKLAELKRLHTQTDYSGMSTEEKIRLIEDRWSCFPTWAMISNLYGPICINHETGEPMNKYSVRDHVAVEYSRQIKEAGIEYKPGQYQKAMYGDMSDEEVIAAVAKKYSGSSMVDRAGMLSELAAMRLDGNDGKTFLAAIDAMRIKLLAMTGGTDSLDFAGGSPWQEMKIERFASNTSISWGAINELLKAYAKENGLGEEASLDWLLDELGKHTESMAEKEAAQHQIQLREMQDDRVQEKYVLEQKIQAQES